MGPGYISEVEASSHKLCVSLPTEATEPATLLKKRLWHRCFRVNFAKFLRTPVLTEHLRWLLLYQEIKTKYKLENTHNTTR